MPNHQNLKTMVKMSTDQKLRLRNFDARNEKIETGTVVTSRRGLSGVERGQGECYQWKAKGQCSRGDKCRACKINTKKRSILSHQHKEVEVRREKRNFTGWSPSGKSNRLPCRDFLTGICTKLPCDYWHPPECQFYKTESGCKFGDKCSFAHRQVEGQPSKKKGKRMVTKGSGLLKDARRLGCVFQDTEPPESSPILRKSKSLGITSTSAIHKSYAGPSLGKFQVKVPHQRSPYALKFEDRSQEETERQERCARGDAWRLAKNIFKLKE